MHNGSSDTHMHNGSSGTHMQISSCRCSETVPTLTPDDFEKHLRETLDEIMKIPRVFVNLVLTGNISGVSKHASCMHEASA